MRLLYGLAKYFAVLFRWLCICFYQNAVVSASANPRMTANGYGAQPSVDNLEAARRGLIQLAAEFVQSQVRSGGPYASK